jgi:hypothetical protein
MKYIFFLWKKGLDIQKVEPKDVLTATMVGGEHGPIFNVLEAARLSEGI